MKEQQVSKSYRVRPAFLLAAMLSITIWNSASPAEDGSAHSWKAPARAANQKNPIAPDRDSINVGKALYAKECAACHGESGKGNGPDAADLPRPPTDFTAPSVRLEADGELFWKISEGKKPMPRYARTFKDEERWHVVNYIRSLSSRKPD